jgi:outer membrane murein-binding lipoprotein Lpp
VRTIAVIALVLVVAGSAPAAGVDAADDVRTLVAEIERLHPDPYHSVSRTEFHRVADDLAARAPTLGREQLLVESMRLVALLGEREGHSGVGPVYAGHRVPLHAFPWRLWRFPDGYYVIRAVDSSLVGARLVAVAGTPIGEVEAKVRPLVTRDNDSSLAFGLPFFLVSAEVLRGLGITSARDTASFTVVTRTGATREVALTAMTIPGYQRAVPFSGFIPAPQGMPRRRQPLYQRLSGERYGITPLQRGRAVYVAYNQTTYPGLIPRRLLRLASKPKVRRVVIDLRLNGGGNNTSYGSLLAALRSRTINRPGKLAVLTSRVTFSAAGNFAADVDHSTRARFFGEPTGGSPNNYGDAQGIDLPALGVTVFTATQWVEVAPGDSRLSVEPDVPVAFTAADYFAGRDPVLAAALR